MKTALKCKNDKFLVMPLKHVLSVMDLVNHSETPKLWAISHENGPNMQKQRVLGHASEKCAECHGPFQRLIKQSQLFETSHATAKPLSILSKRHQA
jgi:hypothetical protein